MFFEFIGEMMGDFDFNVTRKYQKYTTTTSEDKEIFENLKININKEKQLRK